MGVLLDRAGAPARKHTNEAAAISTRLTDIVIRNAEPRDAIYRLFAGEGLFVVVYPSGRKSFEYRYKAQGKLIALVLGRYGNGTHELTLKAAARERDRLAQLRQDGRDPRAETKLEAERQRNDLAEARTVAQARAAAEAAERSARERQRLTFRVVADEWVSVNKPHWTAAHAAQVDQQLRDHVYPTLGARSVDLIRPADVLDLLRGMLTGRKVELARRARQRLNSIFEFAALKHGVQINPVVAARSVLTPLFKTARAAAPAQNFPSIDPKEAPALLRAMRAYHGAIATRTMLWLVALTACRTGEARFATWNEFDLDVGEWDIPAVRMKAGQAHKVFLSAPVVALLRELQRVQAARPGARGFVFPHPRRKDKPASENALLYVLAEIGYKERMSGHGFRSLFSTLANDSGLWRPDVIEASLAHQEPVKVRADYNKAQYLAQRRELMDWYAQELQRLESVASVPEAIRAKRPNARKTAARPA